MPVTEDERSIVDQLIAESLRLFPEDFDAACLQERRLQAQFYVAAGLFTSADCDRSLAPRPTVEELAEAGEFFFGAEL